mgnify:CR=1 FL=1
MSDEMKYLYVENNIDEVMSNCFNCASECVEEYPVYDRLGRELSTAILCIECGALWNNITRRVITKRAKIYMKETRKLLLKLKEGD